MVNVEWRPTLARNGSPGCVAVFPGAHVALVRGRTSGQDSMGTLSRENR